MKFLGYIEVQCKNKNENYGTSIYSSGQLLNNKTKKKTIIK